MYDFLPDLSSSASVSNSMSVSSAESEVNDEAPEEDSELYGLTGLDLLRKIWLIKQEEKLVEQKEEKEREELSYKLKKEVS